MAKIKIIPTLIANEDIEKPDHSYNTGENLKQHRCSDKQPLSLKTKYTDIILPRNHTTGHLPQRNEKFYINTNIHFICNSKKLGTTKMSINR